MPVDAVAFQITESDMGTITTLSELAQGDWFIFKPDEGDEIGHSAVCMVLASAPDERDRMQTWNFSHCCPSKEVMEAEVIRVIQDSPIKVRTYKPEV